MRKIVFNLEVRKGLISEQSVSDQLSQPWNVPLTIPQIVEEASQSFFPLNLECFEEEESRALHTQIGIQYSSGSPNRFDQALGIVSRLFRRVKGALQKIHIYERNYSAFDPVIYGWIRALRVNQRPSRSSISRCSAFNVSRTVLANSSIWVSWRNFAP